MVKTFTTLIAILVGYQALVGDDAAPTEARSERAEQLATEVKQLIRDLDSDRLTVRREAEQRLWKLGPAILPHIPPPELISPRGVRRTVERLRIRLQRQKAQESVKPSRITVSGRQPFSQLLAELGAQSGNQLATDHLPEILRQRPLAFTAESESYWKTLDRVLKEVGLRYEFPPSVGQIQLVPRDANVGPKELAVAYEGAFRVTVEAARWREKYEDLRLRLGIAAEPRLRPLFVKVVAANFSGVSDGDQILSPKSPDAQWELPVTGSGSLLYVPLDLVGAKQKVQNLKLLGRVTVTVAGGEEPIPFSELAGAKNIVRRRGGVTVTLTDVKSKKQEDGRYDAVVRVAVAYDAGGPAFESHRTWIYHNRVYLENEQGERVDFPGGQRTFLARDGAVVVEYPFQDLPKSPAAYRFVYVAPTLILEVPVDFEFKKVSLPPSVDSTQSP